MGFTAPFTAVFTALTRAVVGNGLTFFLRDDFTTSDAAPVGSPRTCEPGPGTLVFTQVASNDQYAISGGRLIQPTAPSAANSGALDLVSYPRTPGLAVVGKVRVDSGNGDLGAALWKADQNVDARNAGGARWGLFLIGGPSIAAFTSTNGALAIYQWSLGVDYYAAVVLRSSGALMFIKGGIFTDWVLMHVATIGSNTPVWPCVAPRAGGAAGYDTFRVVQLPEPFASDTAFVRASYAGAVASGQQFSHSANTIYDFTLTTLPTSGVIAFDLRKQDDNNKWSVEIGSTGTMTLYKTTAGSKVSQASTSGNIAGSRLLITMYRSNILMSRPVGSGASAGVIDTALMLYPDGELTSLGSGGVISDLTLYASECPPSAAAVLDVAVADDTTVAPATKQFICEGDSITEGVGATSPWPTQALAMLGSDWRMKNVATTGETTANMLASRVTQILSRYDAALSRNVLVVYAGVNDINTGVADVTIQANLAQLCSEAKAIGFYVVVCTLAAFSTDATGEAKRQTLNASIRTDGPTYANAVADLGADSRVGDPGDNANLVLFQVDGIHPTDAGLTVWAELITAVIPA